jgi:peptidoglycan/xylan/chitin deacetylase (PgdA/CDA1 family)
MMRWAATRALAGPAWAVLLMLMQPATATEPGTDHAVVLLYHHVAEDTPASTSVRPARFAEHLDWLIEHEYRVLPLEPLLEALRSGRPVPDRAVAITFDDAWVSVHEIAAPMLAERGFPFTVFVNTDAVDARQGPVMSWDQLRALDAMGGTLGSHSASHDHLPALRDGESTAAWQQRIDADLQRAVRRIEEETGQGATLFAYPYGEDSPDLAARVAEQHRFALVQRSGAVGVGGDLLAVPRFPLATGFDGLDRLERAVRARPLPLSNPQPQPEGRAVRSAPLAGVSFDLGPGGFRRKALACYASAGDALSVELRGSTRVHIDTEGLDRPGRNKINCTAPAEDGSGDWYWYAYQWLREPLE